ncbi:MAG: NYN domain-containing protein [Xylophilus sp.]|nr:NYN domain-containing protein [Xylophilus sp.]
MLIFLIDADNLCASAWVEEAFCKLESAQGSIAVRRAYGSADKLKGLTDVLRARAIRPYVNLALTKNTTDVALAVDAMELSFQTPRPTIVAIGSGDADFVPLVLRLRERGFRVVCVSERNKMAAEAVVAYDQVFLVGELISAEPTVAQPTAPKSIARPAPAKKAPAKKVAVKKSMPVVKKSTGAEVATVTVDAILTIAPALVTGQFQHLSDVGKLLHDAKLLSKNATSPKLFKKFPHHFELSPLKQPNKVRFILPLAD